MKPGMQRDILVAYWLLFDEFGIGDDDPPPAQTAQADAVTPTDAAKAIEKPKRNNGGKGRGRP
jgi:hypothetical protein